MPEAKVADRVSRNPVVVKANFYQFGRGEKLENPPAESRMLLWCSRGKGRLIVEGEQVRLEPGVGALLPWNKRRCYESSAREPLHVGGIHIVPNHLAGFEVEFVVARGRGHPLSNCPYRLDNEIMGQKDLFTFDVADDGELIHLSLFIVSYFSKSKPPEKYAREMGEMLLHCIEDRLDSRDESNGRAPTPIKQAMDYVEAHMHEPIHIEDLLQVTDCSRSTLNRHFRKYLGTSANEWVVRAKLKRAESLLKTTSLPISEVAERVGVFDPFYFSQLFKKRLGMPPSRYRACNQLI